MSEFEVVIRVEGLGKKVSLHHEQSERTTALRHLVARQAKAAGELLNPFTLAGQLRRANRCWAGCQRLLQGWRRCRPRLCLAA